MSESEFHQFKLRLPVSLFKQLEEKAAESNRSVSAEIVLRLHRSLNGFGRGLDVLLQQVQPEPTQVQFSQVELDRKLQEVMENLRELKEHVLRGTERDGKLRRAMKKAPAKPKK